MADEVLMLIDDRFTIQGLIHFIWLLNLNGDVNDQLSFKFFILLFSKFSSYSKTAPSFLMKLID